MRFVSFEHNGAARAGVRDGDEIKPVEEIDPAMPGSVLEVLQQDKLDALRATDHSGVEGIPLDSIRLLPPIPRPGKIICIGRNYAAHAAEGGAETPTFPEIFYRGATTLIAHGDDIIRPHASDKLDFEGEFVAVIGKRCRHASEEEALEYVAGYSLFNDATLRDYQRFSTQWTIGKNFDGTGAFGPEIVTSDELPPGLAGLTLTTHLNGEQMQIGNIDDLVFPVTTLIEILSRCMTLEPGDIISTGTPSGVGFARKPPLWMKPGDTVEIEVEGVGKLVNSVRDEA